MERIGAFSAMVCMEFGIFIEHNEEFELSDSCNEELGEF